MKRTLWLVAGLLWASWADAAKAQVVVVSGYGPDFVTGGGFEYRSKHFKVGGFFLKGYSGSYTIGPYGTIYPGPYGFPAGVVQKNVTINIYNPPPFGSSPAKDYDLSGVDLDVVRPDKGPPPTKVNGTVGPEPTPAPVPEMPGQDVSVPKKAFRPEDNVPPPKPKVEVPPKVPAEFPKLPTPLPIAREESDRLIVLALEEFKEGDFGLATQHFHKAALADPNNLLAHLLLSQGDFAFARYEAAVKSIRAAAALDKEYPNLKFRPRLSLYKGMEPEFDEQLAMLREAVKQNPNSPTLLFLLGHQLWFDDQRDAALELFRLARPLTPDPSLVDLFLNAAKVKVIAAK